MYGGIHNKKIFKYANEHFKLLEDLLGEVDYYDGFAKQFLANNEIPSTIRLFMEQRKAEKINELNSILLNKKWINHDPSRTKKIRKKLLKVNWRKPKEEIKLIGEYYLKSIDVINEFYKNTGNAFTDLELQVHDLRRKLRWLSIYPQALRGAIQLVDNVEDNEALKKYLIPAIVNSPFNVMPEPANNQIVLILEKKYFYSLSFVISQLGKIKDKGLSVLAIAEAVENTQFVNKEIATERAFELLHFKNAGLNSILKEAKEVCKPFFIEDNLGKLVVGVEIL